MVKRSIRIRLKAVLAAATVIEIPLSVAEVDVSEYMSNGEFTLTYPKTGAQFFYLRIGDN